MGGQFHLEPEHVTELGSAVIVHDREAVIDPDLRRAGTPHLEAVVARSPGMFDGVVLALDRVDDGVVHAVSARYFDMVATCDALDSNPSMRERAEQLAAPDPLRIGAGRAAAIGVSIVVVRNGVFTLGRRSPELPLDPGRWHVVASGTLDERGLAGTIADELAGEHDIAEMPDVRIIGLGYDLPRLRPELAVMTADLGDVPPPSPSDEFVEFREVPLDLDRIADVWALDLTPAAAVAVAALERELRG
jgi:hypothetical protein